MGTATASCVRGRGWVVSEDVFPPSWPDAESDLARANHHCERVAGYLKGDLIPDNRDIARAVLALRDVVAAMMQA